MKKFAYVTISCKMTKEKLLNFIEDNLINIEIKKVKDGEALIKWPLNEQDGIHQIEETLYYLLEEKRIGTYDCYIPNEK